jgi:hypothetical protein
MEQMNSRMTSIVSPPAARHFWTEAVCCSDNSVAPMARTKNMLP